MLDAVSSHELSEWQAFEIEHGPVWQRPDLTAAYIVCTLTNIYRDTKKHPEPYEVSEFLIGGSPEFEQTPEQMALVAELSAMAMSAAETRRGALPQ